MRKIRGSDDTVIAKAVRALTSDSVVGVVDKGLLGTKWDDKPWNPKERSEKIRDLIRYIIRTELKAPKAT